MSPTSKLRATTRLLAALSGACLAATSLSASAAPVLTADPLSPLSKPATSDYVDGNYMVVLKESPVATYTGGTKGIPATKPAAGERLDPKAKEVKQYKKHLDSAQEAVIKSAGVKPLNKATTVVNGFSANLTAKQAAKLARDGRVMSVTKSRNFRPDTITSPEFLGLTKGTGAWRKYGIPRKAGEGVVVGIIDTGITPNHPSFSGRKMPAKETGRVNRPSMDAEGNTTMLKSDGNMFYGQCETGEGFTLAHCNDKLISARAFSANLRKPFEDKGEKTPIIDAEVFSPRDTHGHGTHVASTAAGNFGVPMNQNGDLLGRISGMAPAAKVASYKVCFERSDGVGPCNSNDSVMAIDTAVNDGVDVLNYSISGTTSMVNDPVAMAFFNAASAGVFVAASAGNSGPTPSTVNHNTPWLTTVAASTHANYEGTLVLGDGQKMLGASSTRKGLPETKMVHARELAKIDVPSVDAALCLENTLDPEKAKGLIVVCDRGLIARTDKSKHAKEAGAVGSVLLNVGPGGLNADPHTIPTVHLPVDYKDDLYAYLEKDGSKGAILTGNQSGKPSPAVPQVTGFSSRGPAIANDGELLKPDIAAPGSSIAAGVAPVLRGGSMFTLMSGTSMASPHIAGLAGLIYGKHPHWSPMTIKSAMMTTARNNLTAAGAEDVDNFATGAGNVDPTKFFNPGLVYDSGPMEWASFIAGSGVEIDGIEPVRPIDFNSPSLALPHLVGSETVTRTVTAMTPGTYKASANIPGVDMVVEPATLTFAKAGEKKTFTMKVTNKNAKMGAYVHGSMSWTGPANDVTIPVSVRPLAVKAPAKIEGKHSDGEVKFNITSGIDGTLTSEVHGFAAGQVSQGTIAVGEGMDLEKENTSTKFIDLEVGENVELLQLNLNAGEGSNDLDLFLVDLATGDFVPSKNAAATANASESLTIEAPAPGKYRAVAFAYDVVDQGKYELQAFIVEKGQTEGTVLEPASVETNNGKEHSLTLKYSGLDASKPYMAVVSYAGGSAKTIVTVK